MQRGACLLPYYIASLNIEHAVLRLPPDQYAPVMRGHLPRGHVRSGGRTAVVTVNSLPDTRTRVEKQKEHPRCSSSSAIRLTTPGKSTRTITTKIGSMTPRWISAHSLRRMRRTSKLTLRTKTPSMILTSNPSAGHPIESSKEGIVALRHQQQFSGWPRV